MRREIGMVVQPGDTAAATTAVADLVANAPAYQERLAALRFETVYNPGSSAEAGAAALHDLVGNPTGK